MFSHVLSHLRSAYLDSIDTDDNTRSAFTQSVAQIQAFFNPGDEFTSGEALVDQLVSIATNEEYFAELSGNDSNMPKNYKKNIQSTAKAIVPPEERTHRLALSKKVQDAFIAAPTNSLPNYIQFRGDRNLAAFASILSPEECEYFTEICRSNSPDRAPFIMNKILEIIDDLNELHLDSITDDELAEHAEEFLLKSTCIMELNSIASDADKLGFTEEQKEFLIRLQSQQEGLLPARKRLDAMANPYYSILDEKKLVEHPDLEFLATVIETGETHDEFGIIPDLPGKSESALDRYIFTATEQVTGVSTALLFSLDRLLEENHLTNKDIYLADEKGNIIRDSVNNEPVTNTTLSSYMAEHPNKKFQILNKNVEGNPSLFTISFDGKVTRPLLKSDRFEKEFHTQLDALNNADSSFIRSSSQFRTLKDGMNQLAKKLDTLDPNRSSKEMADTLKEMEHLQKLSKDYLEYKAEQRKNPEDPNAAPVWKSDYEKTRVETITRLQSALTEKIQAFKKELHPPRHKPTTIMSYQTFKLNKNLELFKSTPSFNKDSSVVNTLRNQVTICMESIKQIAANNPPIDQVAADQLMPYLAKITMYQQLKDSYSARPNMNPAELPTLEKNLNNKGIDPMANALAKNPVFTQMVGKITLERLVQFTDPEFLKKFSHDLRVGLTVQQQRKAVSQQKQAPEVSQPQIQDPGNKKEKGIVLK